MKKNEIIELNGIEYTLELNRDSFLQIDRLCNIDKSMRIIYRDLYEYMDEEEIAEDFNPDSLIVSDDELEKEIKLKNDTLKKLCERAFYIWLYPNHKLNIEQVKEILKPYVEETEDEDSKEKTKFISQKLGEYLGKCIEIRDNYNQEQKNLKALANK